MIIYKRNEKTGLECGVNNDGQLFLGDNSSGYNLPFTKENKAKVLADFEYYNKSSI